MAMSTSNNEFGLPAINLRSKTKNIYFLIKLTRHKKARGDKRNESLKSEWAWPLQKSQAWKYAKIREQLHLLVQKKRDFHIYFWFLRAFNLKKVTGKRPTYVDAF